MMKQHVRCEMEVGVGEQAPPQLDWSSSLMLFENELVITYSNSQSDIVAELLKRIQVKNENDVENIVPIRRFDYDCYVAMSKWDFVEFLTKHDKN